MNLNVITKPRDYELEDNWGFYIDIENMEQDSFNDNAYESKPIYDHNYYITSEKTETKNKENDAGDLMSHVNSTTIITAALSLSYLIFLIL
jgi:hypothetical protein